LPTKLILVRHGQTLHNVAGKIAGWTDSPLSDVGLDQAERLGTYVAEHYVLDALYSSPLQRARRTAEIVGRLAGLERILRDDLKELNFGDLEELTEAEVSARHPGIWAASQVVDDHSFTWPGGETRSRFYARVRRAFREIVAAHPSQTVAIVSHGGVLGSYVADVVEGHPHLWRKYLLRNCSITEVRAENGRAAVGRFNDYSFLPDYAPDPLLQSLAGASDGASRG